MKISNSKLLITVSIILLANMSAHAKSDGHNDNAKSGQILMAQNTVKDNHDGHDHGKSKAHDDHKGHDHKKHKVKDDHKDHNHKKTKAHDEHKGHNHKKPKAHDDHKGHKH